MASWRGILISQRCIILYLVSLTCIVTLGYCCAIQPLMANEVQAASQRVADEFKIALLKRENRPLLAATRTNGGKTTGSAVCVVDPAITDCRHYGFAAFLRYTLEYIMICRILGINQPTVLWRACNSVCSRDPTMNSWDWYFEPVNRGLESKVENVLCPLWNYDGIEDLLCFRPINNESITNLQTVVNVFDSSEKTSTQERMRVNELIQQYVKPNSRIKEKVRMFYHRYLAGFTVLGVHVRGTDHWRETSEKRLPSLMSWVKKAWSILDTLPRPRKIFIASDNHEVIHMFVSLFGKETVAFTKAVRAKGYHDQIAPHHFKFKHNAADPYEREIGSQVLMDILLLAKCDHFLHTESSVASLASYFNPHMTSYFLQDEKHTKEKEEVLVDETREMKPQKPEDLEDILECFEKNHLGSACPINIAKGIFVNFEQAQRFLTAEP
ncbi:uncharacterized protein LOC144666664 [Oculina patagonica]